MRGEYAPVWISDVQQRIYQNQSNISITINRDNHTVQQQLGTSEKRGNMPQCGYLMHNKMMNLKSSMNCLQTQKSIKHQYAKQWRETKCF